VTTSKWQSISKWLIRFALKALPLITLTIIIPSSTTHAAPSPVFTNCASQIYIPEAECNALLAVYINTAGPSWTNKTGWLSDDDPCNWYGVSCTGGSVVSLSLPNNNLEGSIPTQIGNLSQLITLTLSTNQLSGGIPDQLWDLTNLTLLALNYNQLTGGLSPLIGNLTNLINLTLNGNLLSGPIPAEISGLTNLVILRLNSNLLNDALPTGISSLTALIEINLSYNQFSGDIPSGIGSLSNLTHLTLNNNLLSGTIPASIGSMSNLQYLRLDTNQLTGSIPTELGNLSSIKIFALNSNQLSGTLPSSLGNMLTVTSLGLSSNQFSGSIPASFGSLTALTNLSLQNNLLTGTIPPELGNLSSLLYLYLGYNQLGGSLPPELGNLSSVNIINIYGNQFEGSLPKEMGNLSTLTDLNISNNQFFGSIPKSFIQLALTNFSFSSTFLCEPPDTAFQTWLGSITYMTASGYSCTERLPNVSMEESIPQGWVGKLLSTGVDTVDCGVYRTGSCSYKMIADGDNSVLISYFPGAGLTGDSINLSVYNETSAAGGTGSALLRLVFIHNDETKEIVTAPFNQGAHGWQQTTINATAIKDYRMITVSLIFTLTEGTIWWDDISMTKNGGANLFDAKNPSFESAVPNGWVGKLIAPVVDTTDCTVALIDSCSYTMTGDGDNSVLISYKPYAGLAGDVIDLSVWNKTNAAGGTGSALLRLVIIYNDETKDIITTPFNQGTHDWELAYIRTIAAKPYRMITVSLIFTLTAGDIWWDEASLLISTL